MSNIGNKEIFAKNLSSYMSKKKIDRYKLCDDLDFKYSTLSEWLSAKKYPRIDKIEKLANYFDISKSALIEEHKHPQSNISAIIPPEKIHQIPVYATVSAGLGALAENEVIEYIPMVIENPYDIPDTFGLKVRGDSMYPKIEDGDIIVIRKQESVDSGTVAVVLLDGEEGLVKKVEYGKDWIVLHSFNPEYQDKRFEGAEVQRLRVVGKVMKVVKSL